MDWKVKLVMTFRVLVAAFLGALIGWESERHGHDAGLHTYAAVAPPLFERLGPNQTVVWNALATSGDHSQHKEDEEAEKERSGRQWRVWLCMCFD